MRCDNCGGDWEVRSVSFDLDLPVIAMCGVCEIYILTDLDEFERRGEAWARKRRREKR